MCWLLNWHPPTLLRILSSLLLGASPVLTSHVCSPHQSGHPMSSKHFFLLCLRLLEWVQKSFSFSSLSPPRNDVCERGGSGRLLPVLARICILIPIFDNKPACSEGPLFKIAILASSHLMAVVASLNALYWLLQACHPLLWAVGIDTAPGPCFTRWGPSEGWVPSDLSPSIHYEAYSKSLPVYFLFAGLSWLTCVQISVVSLSLCHRSLLVHLKEPLLWGTMACCLPGWAQFSDEPSKHIVVICLPLCEIWFYDCWRWRHTNEVLTSFATSHCLFY